VLVHLCDGHIGADLDEQVGLGVAGREGERHKDQQPKWEAEVHERHCIQRNGGPVLKDRGFGYAVFGPYWGEDLGYPTWAVMRPDMNVLFVGKGFESWDEVRDLIVEDAG